MQTTLNIDKMTVADKLLLIERLWDALQRDPEAVPSPGWHEEVLHQREEKVRECKATFSDWSDAKQRIRSQTT